VAEEENTHHTSGLAASDIPLVIVSGLPASGKSTLSRTLAAALSLTLIDKDVILEGLFEMLGTGDADWRQKLSRGSDEILRRLVKSSAGAVVTSFWRHHLMKGNSGTPTHWISSASQRIVEVYCVCDPEIAAARFVTRQRHPGHLDTSKPLEEVMSDFRLLSRMGPLRIGRLVQVNTSGNVDVRAIGTQVGCLLAEAGPQC
jgi:shikimate kinase